MVRCIIIKNVKNHSDGKLIAVPGSLEELLKVAEDKLKIKATKIYAYTGSVIDDVSVIKEDEKIYISGGEPFFKRANGNLGNGNKVRNLQIAVLGPGGVGKSCISMRYTKSAFVEVYDPTIEDSFRRHETVDGVTFYVEILDTAGQEDLKILRRSWIVGREGFLVVYSILERNSFEELPQFLDLIKQVEEEEERQIPIVIVGNKADLAAQRKVPLAEAQALAESYNARYIETSAKEGTNVDESFELLLREFLINDEAKPATTGKSSSSHRCNIL